MPSFKELQVTPSETGIIFSLGLKTVTLDKKEVNSLIKSLKELEASVKAIRLAKLEKELNDAKLLVENLDFKLKEEKKIS